MSLRDLMVSSRQQKRTKESWILPLGIGIGVRETIKETDDWKEGKNEIAVGVKVLSVLSVTKKGTEE